jgi:hypothetical protein
MTTAAFAFDSPPIKVAKRPQTVVVIPTPKPIFTPTNEQLNIGVSMALGVDLKINAFAGTGKSATLNYIANLYDRVGELWCFNTRNAKEAQEKFNKDKTYCCTSHSKAFRAMNMFEFGAKLRDKWPIWMISRELGVGRSVGITAEHVTHAALTSLRRWMHSADPVFTINHCWDRLRTFEWFRNRILENDMLAYPNKLLSDRMEWTEKALPGLAYKALQEYQSDLFSVSQEIWRTMWDIESKLPMDHDAYLKAYQLSRPILKNISYLMIDEYQDTNACVADLVNMQTCQKIAVGDEFQGIYGFRGAIGGMKKFVGMLHYLTKSYRFGPEGAKIANAILAAHYPDIPQLFGTTSIKTSIGPVDQSQQYAVITRSNAELFSQAILAVSSRKSIFVVGSLKDAISRVRSVYGIAVDRRDLVKHPDIKPYEDWKTVLAESESDSEMKRYVDAVAEYGNDLPAICDTLEKAREAKADKANVILTTAHKSKGFGFNQVVLANDFSLRVETDPYTGKPAILGSDEEFNGLYVAATRVVNRLQLNDVAKIAVDLHG